MNIRETIIPVYHSDYDVGDIGFVTHNSFLSRGIRWFTRHWRFRNPAVSHVFVVVGDGKIIEANGDGVDVESLSEYANDPAYTVYIRRVAGWTPALGAGIAAAALKYEGLKYDYDLILADAASYSLLGRLVNSLTRDTLDGVLTDLATSKGAMICDQVAVTALQDVPGLRPRGTLKIPAARNNPQRLFGDEELFQPDVVMFQGRNKSMTSFSIFPIFAQGIDTVPAPFLKNALALLLAFCVGAGGWAALMAYLKRKERPERAEKERPSNRMPNVRRDMFDLEISLVKSKLGEHSVEIGKLWEVMREEDKQIRETLSRAIRDFEGATERLEGTLSEVKALAQKLLEKALE